MLSNLNIKAVIKAALSKEQPLSLELLDKITDTSTTTYDLINLLCDYINASNKVERGDDLAAYCEMTHKIESLTAQNRLLVEKYNKAINDILSIKEHELELSRNASAAELEILKLKGLVKDLESRVNISELLRT